MTNWSKRKAKFLTFVPCIIQFPCVCQYWLYFHLTSPLTFSDKHHRQVWETLCRMSFKNSMDWGEFGSASALAHFSGRQTSMTLPVTAVKLVDSLDVSQHRSHPRVIAWVRFASPPRRVASESWWGSLQPRPATRLPLAGSGFQVVNNPTGMGWLNAYKYNPVDFLHGSSCLAVLGLADILVFTAWNPKLTAL